MIRALVVFLLLLMSPLSPALGQPVTSSDLLKLLESSQPDYLEDLTLQYEGRVILPRAREQSRQGTGPDGVKEVFSGFYGYRKNGESFGEVFIENKAKRGGLTRFFLSNGDGRSVVYSKRIDSPTARAVVGEPSFVTLNRPGFPERVLLTNLVRDYVSKGFIMEMQGTEPVAGAACQVVRFVLRRTGEPPPRPGQMEESTKFWIDFGRGGSFLRKESLYDGKLAQRVSVGALERVEVGTGRYLWLPTRARAEGFLTVDDEFKWVFTEEPISIEEYSLLKSSVAVNVHFGNARFEPSYKAGDQVNDRLQNIRYRFGSYRSPPDKVTSLKDHEARLRELIRDAKAQGSALRAGSWERGSGRIWIVWLPWLISGGAFAAAGVVALRARRSGRRAC